MRNAEPREADFYRTNVLRTCPNIDKDDVSTKLGLGALGLAGETGEVVDIIKKVLHHGMPLEEVREKIVKELGDVRWYLEYLAMAMNVTMEEIEAVNVAKLRARYPDGFNFEAAAKHRASKA